MNKIYRHVWSQVHNALIPVSEIAGSVSPKSSPRQKNGIALDPKTKTTEKSRKAQLARALALLLAGVSPVALALPSGGHVKHGQASIHVQGNNLTVDQGTKKAIINWQKFGIKPNESVNFNQPNVSSITLNRVIGNNPSKIMGHLSANGQIFLVNPSGITFGKNASVDAGGIVASTLNITNKNFLNNNYQFQGSSTNSVINKGHIKTSQGGSVAFIGHTVNNQGQISTPGGTTVLGAGQRVDLTLSSNHLLHFAVKQSALQASAKNGGLIKANHGGKVVLTAHAKNAALKTVVNNKGVIRAHSVKKQQGHIALLGGKSGTTKVSGTLDASANTNTSNQKSPQQVNGGTIETSGAHVKIANKSQITTKGLNGGQDGTWTIDPKNFTIAALSSNGDISAYNLGNKLSSNNVTIKSSQGSNGSNGNIYVNSTVSWSSHKLTLSAYNNIILNSNLKVSSNAKLAFKYGQGSSNGIISSQQSDYILHSNSKVDLGSNTSFSTQLGTNGTIKNYKIVNSLGSPNSTNSNTLQGMGASSNLSNNYVLGSNINAKATGSNTNTWGTNGFKPIGSNSSNEFTGTFSGLGHSISNLYINRPSTNKIGLFGIAKNETFRNLKLNSNNITGNSNIGGLVGVGSNGLIKNVSSSGTISGSYLIGGLVGTNSNSIVKNAHVNGSVKGKGVLGGLVGGNYYSTIRNSYAKDSVTGSSSNVGGLVGSNDNNSKIVNSYATGTVKNTSINTGGLVGVNTNGKISNSYATGSVNGTKHTGGLVGASYIGSTNKNPSIKNSYANGNVSASNNAVGGLVGISTNTAISQSYATGTVSGGSNASNIGGLVGASYSNSSILNSYAIGKVSGSNSNIGGLVGKNANSTIKNDYATGAVSGKNNVGGLIGHNKGSAINFVYATGNVSGTNSNIGGLIGFNDSNSPISQVYADGAVSGSNASNVGGLVGFNNSGNSISNAYWDTTIDNTSGRQSIGNSTNTNAKGLTTKSLASSIPSGFQSSNWGNANGQTTPYLKANSSSYTVSGYVIPKTNTSTTPNLFNVILNVKQLQHMNQTGMAKNYLLGKNINASSTAHWNNGKGFKPLGNFKHKFSGIFNGLGYKIKGLTINRPGKISVGLFNNVGQYYSKDAIVKNLGLVNENIIGSSYIGGLAASTYSAKIKNVYVTGKIAGSSELGGMIGESSSNTIMKYDYSTATIKGKQSGNSSGNNSYVGGLIGYDNGKIIDSYATGNVSGSNSVGGLIGFIDAYNLKVKNSYATGNVSGDGGAIGGLIGSDFDGTVSNVYSSGKITDYYSGASHVGGTNNHAGGLIGHLNCCGAINNAYWDKSTLPSGLPAIANNQGTTSNINALTSAQMKQPSNFGTFAFSKNNSSTWYIYNDDTEPLLNHYLSNITVSGGPTSSFTYGKKVAQILPYYTYSKSSAPSQGHIKAQIGNANSTNNQYINVGSNYTTDFYSNQQGYRITLNNPTKVTIKPKSLTASIINNPTKIYNGTNGAIIPAGDTQLSGFVGNQGASSKKTNGAYAQSNAGTNIKITESINSSNFNINSNTSLSNYTLPNQATGPGTIKAKSLTASFANTPTKTYNGTNGATIASGNINLNGFVGNQGATSKKVTGSYAQSNAGSNIKVSANISSSNFNPNSNTTLSNYTIPSSVSSSSGIIKPKQLTSSFANAPTKTYNGTNGATIAAGNINLNGFVGNQGATSKKVTGSYNQSSAGSNIKVSANISSSNFNPNSNTTLSNYKIPSSVSSTSGTIKPKQLTASILNNPTKTYNGTNGITINGSNISLNGFVGSQGGSVSSKQINGQYSQTNAGSNISVSANLNNSNVSTQSNTSLSNYNLPSKATGSFSGTGTIQPKQLSASIINNPTKTYNGTNGATIPAGDTQLKGFVGNQGTKSKQISGTYAQSSVGSNIKITESLSSSNFNANSNTSLSNYKIPNTATGLGTIKPKQLTANITSNPTKTYNGTNNTTIGSGNITLSGFASNQGASSSTQSVTGTYNKTSAGSNIKLSAQLNSSDFKANSNTSFANYKIPSQTSSNFTGTGTIKPKSLTASFANAPTKTYNGSNGATIASGNINLNGFIGNQGAKSKQVSGTYAQSNAGSNIKVSASLSSSNFNPNSNTTLSNYTIPSSVSSGSGVIKPKQLTANITNNPTKTYNGTNGTTIASGNISLSGFVGNQGASASTQSVAGTYNQTNAGSNIKLSANLSGSDFRANSNTSLTNYKLPSKATGSFSGTGTIQPKQLSASITSTPTKTYNGTNGATIASGNINLNGFIGNQGAQSKQVKGTYAQANAGSNITVNANISSSNFNPNSNTILSNYSIPNSVSGTGKINPKQLSASIINNPTKTYDGTTSATIPAGDTQLSGFVGSQGAQSKQISGTYAQASAGTNIKITESLSSSNFNPNSNTQLSNYKIPSTATGTGTIKPKSLKLSSSITSHPTKVYDGTNGATIAKGNITLSGFQSSQSSYKSTNQVNGSFAQSNAGSNIKVTAPISANDFNISSNVSMSNYTVPKTATGTGTIKPKQLSARMIGNPTKAYNGSNGATISSGNITLNGFVGHQGATSKQVSGTYAQSNAGSNINVSAQLSNNNFNPNSNTTLSNYIIPNKVVGVNKGTIKPKQLTANINNNPTKTYNGTNNTTIASGDITLSGFVGNQGASASTQSVTGTYNQASAGSNVKLSANLNTNDFNFNSNTSLNNYNLPSKATGSFSGTGTIQPKSLTANFANVPTKTYNGTNSTTISAGNINLNGFVGNQGATSKKVNGTYNQASAGSNIKLSASISSHNFNPNSNTSLNNYQIPNSVSGTGAIKPKQLTANITNNPTKTYNGTNNTTIPSGNITLSGFVGNQGASASTKSVKGIYNQVNAGSNVKLSANLNGNDFNANSNTSLSNYQIPSQATGHFNGTGKIKPKHLSAKILGNPTKAYNGSNGVTISKGNINLNGFVGHQGATSKQVKGSFNQSNVGQNIKLIISLNSNDFIPNSNTKLSNYSIPSSVTGTGTIKPKHSTRSTNNPIRYAPDWQGFSTNSSSNSNSSNKPNQSKNTGTTRLQNAINGLNNTPNGVPVQVIHGGLNEPSNIIKQLSISNPLFYKSHKLNKTNNKAQHGFKFGNKLYPNFRQRHSQ